MPEISRFFGIVIGMYYNDHAPPHFHAAYGEHRCKIDLATGEVIEGHLPRRALALVAEWCRLRRTELQQDWRLAQDRKPLLKIEPLE